MQLPVDSRLLGLPCVLAASGLQYLRFAKKPMAAPCHRVSDRCSRRFLVVGLAAEVAALRLLPLCEAYPMNASCLTFLYFWKETKRAKAIQKNEVLACISALSAWGLPYVDPSGGHWHEEMQASTLLDAVLSPRTCAYVVFLLLGGALLCCSLSVVGDSAFTSCLPPALNFGVSALLLKAAAQVVASLLLAPWRLELWAALPILAVLIVGVRSAASAPLRRALEAHDNLSVLASYGAMSGAAATLTGGFVYSEMAAWGSERQALYAVLAIAHCWGMRSLSLSGAELRGSAGQKTKVEDEGTSVRGQRERIVASSEKALQMVEMTTSAAAAKASNPATERALAGSSAAVSSSSASSSVGATGRERGNGGRHGGGGGGSSVGPLLNFAEDDTSHRRSVDDDALEEQLFAKALAPLALHPQVGGEPHLEADSFAVAAGGEVADVPQFDADFEELMRRFDEDDKSFEQPITALALESFECEPESPKPAAAGTGRPMADLSPALPGVLALDAQALLDGAGQDDEDELLKSIEDIP
eukprot:TRINITY_DN88740_c0_g1_i1.p1 TRINITY_DN88740_c0_g1~~TRINITY_DN88740_c0_g1_i1.p1  ORF type:complete len:548 (-),score=131.67 TRINITY_DN88740_c0_g1_i1:27-1616(-)